MRQAQGTAPLLEEHQRRFSLLESRLQAHETRTGLEAPALDPKFECFHLRAVQGSLDGQPYARVDTGFARGALALRTNLEDSPENDVLAARDSASEPVGLLSRGTGRPNHGSRARLHVVSFGCTLGGSAALQRDER